MPSTSTNTVSSRKHTNQTDVSYTNLDTNSSLKNSLHLLQTTTSNMKAKQKLTCVVTSSAVHRSRRAGAGVLTYFAGAGVCSPPVKL